MGSSPVTTYLGCYRPHKRGLPLQSPKPNSSQGSASKTCATRMGYSSRQGSSHWELLSPAAQRAPELPRGTDGPCPAALPKGQDKPQERQRKRAPEPPPNGESRSAGHIPGTPQRLGAGCRTAPPPPRTPELLPSAGGTGAAHSHGSPRVTHAPGFTLERGNARTRSAFISKSTSSPLPVGRLEILH